MGRRNYDLTRIKPGSPAWICRQERKGKKILPQIDMLACQSSEVESARESSLLDPERTPRALPVVTEEEDTGDITPIALTFPRQVSLPQHQSDMSNNLGVENSMAPSGNCGNLPSRQGMPAHPARFPPELSCLNDGSCVQAQSPGDLFLEHPGPDEGQCPSPPGDFQWQNMTEEEHQLGNKILRVLAAQSFIPPEGVLIDPHGSVMDQSLIDEDDVDVAMSDS
ncbi:hypothetical protein NLU13_8524 [Sarocladium strictum]|uniref:Uncharacterized protein n=1 Tax=Sarocladium strictum TaxID=5046 RepID=A0AA39L529_SARSR|nr:hypothetical protein NLU13_8524 [Sarocladium strictum]